MTLLAWLLRVLFLVLLVRFIVRLLFGAGRAIGRRSGTRPPERAGGTLVRDPHCGTYLPISRAVRVGAGPTALYFCSSACRDAHAKSTSDSLAKESVRG